MPVGGWNGYLSRLRSLRVRVEASSLEGVRAAQQTILQRAKENLAPHSVTSNLEESGYTPEPRMLGGVARGAVTFGNASTQTAWHGGTGYEQFVEQGTQAHEETPRRQGGVLAFDTTGGTVFTTHVDHPGTAAVHFLENAVLESMPELLEVEATAFREALVR